MEKGLAYDVGMNNGDDTAYYLHLGYNVVAVEADPTLVAEAKTRFAREIERGRLTVVYAAVAEHEGSVPFFVCDDKREWNSLDHEEVRRRGLPFHAVQVPCRTFASILAEYGVPEFLKVDIEGSGNLCIEGLMGDDLPAVISMEVDGWKDFSALRQLGYDSFKLIDQNRHRRVALEPASIKARAMRQLEQTPRVLALTFFALGKVRRLSGKIARLTRVTQRPPNHSFLTASGEWYFAFGSSGPFGDQADGPWEPLDEIVRRWIAAKQLNQFFPDCWFDVHAKRRTATS